MKVWATRDDEGTDRCDIWEYKPTRIFRNKTSYYTNGEMLQCFAYSAKEFKRDFGFTPRKGSCKQYNLKLEAIT